MSLTFKEKIKQLSQNLTLKKPWDNIVIFLLNILIAIPIFIIIHQNIIDPEWPFHIDRILIFIGLLALIQLLLRLMRRVIIISIVIYMIFLIYGTIFGNYGFRSVFEDYKVMIFAMAENPHPQD